MATRNNDPNCLHPRLRAATESLLRALAAEEIPLRLFEGWRSPERQAALYAQGRVDGFGLRGKHVTFARAWTSYHQYGLAVDLVFWTGGGYSWAEPRPGLWRRYHELARTFGLEPLSFEAPHVQLAGMTIAELRAGRYPADGDESWAQTLDTAIAAWGSAPRLASGLQHPGAPPEVWQRPELQPPFRESAPIPG